MVIVVNILIILASLLLVLVVLVQNSKGGGLASNFAGSNQVMGVRKTTDFLEKATWGLAIALVVFCLASSLLVQKTDTATKKSALEEQVANEQPVVPQGMQAPAAPAEESAQ